MEVNFVLVEPAVPENIGSSARALKTMGFSKLSLVNPCEYLTGKAKWVAHGSYDILENAGCFKNLNDAIKGACLTIGSTARYRSIKQDYMPASNLNEYIGDKDIRDKEIAIIFGREESGLTNKEMELCDITTSIPLAANYPSLNLGQAVMLFAFILSHTETNNMASGNDISDNKSLKNLKMLLLNFIDESGMKINDPVTGRIMERIALASQKDLNLMFSFIASASEAFKKGKS